MAYAAAGFPGRLRTVWAQGVDPVLLGRHNCAARGLYVEPVGAGRPPTSPSELSLLHHGAGRTWSRAMWRHYGIRPHRRRDLRTTRRWRCSSLLSPPGLGADQGPGDAASPGDHELFSSSTAVCSPTHIHIRGKATPLLRTPLGALGMLGRRAQSSPRIFDTAIDAGTAWYSRNYHPQPGSNSPELRSGGHPPRRRGGSLQQRRRGFVTEHRPSTCPTAGISPRSHGRAERHGSRFYVGGSDRGGPVTSIGRSRPTRG